MTDDWLEKMNQAAIVVATFEANDRKIAILTISRFICLDFDEANEQEVVDDIVGALELSGIYLDINVSTNRSNVGTNLKIQQQERKKERKAQRKKERKNLNVEDSKSKSKDDFDSKSFFEIGNGFPEKTAGFNKRRRRLKPETKEINIAVKNKIKDIIKAQRLQGETEKTEEHELARESTFSFKEAEGEATRLLVKKLFDASYEAVEESGADRSLLAEMKTRRWKGMLVGLIKNQLLDRCESQKDFDHAVSVWSKAIDAYFKDTFWSSVAITVPNLMKFARGAATSKTVRTPGTHKPRYRVIRSLRYGDLNPDMKIRLRSAEALVEDRLDYVFEDSIPVQDLKLMLEWKVLGEPIYEHEIPSKNGSKAS